MPIIEVLAFVLITFISGWMQEKKRIANDKATNEYPCIRMVDDDEVETQSQDLKVGDIIKIKDET